MNKLWKDPVFSNVIAASIIAIFGAAISAITIYFQANIQDPRQLFSALLTSTVSINLFLLASIVLGLLMWMIYIYATEYRYDYDIFLSAPMSAFPDGVEYEKFRKFCVETRDLLQQECGFDNVYYAGDNKRSDADFSTPLVAARADIKALKRSKRFLLIHGGKHLSSTIFEAGFAFEKGIRSVYCHLASEELPFLMKQLSNFNRVNTYQLATYSDLLQIIKNDKSEIFK